MGDGGSVCESKSLETDALNREWNKMIDECPICNSPNPDSPYICICGYSFEKDEIYDIENISGYYNTLKASGKWIKVTDFTRCLHEFQQRKKGKTSVGAKGGWGYRHTASMLREKSVSIISDNINLSIDSENFPELLNCENRAKAIEMRKRLISGSISRNFTKFKSEQELQNFIESHWAETPFSEEWEFIKGNENAGDAGQIDILARHLSDACWLIIELKKGRSPDKTVGQILRYMGWFKSNRAKENEKIKGVIIYSYPPDKNMQYALLNTRNVTQTIYYRLDGKTKFLSEEEAFNILHFEQLSFDEQRKFLES